MDRTSSRESTRSPGARELHLVLALVLLLIGGGCRNFPLSIYIDDEVFAELEETSFDEEIGDEEIATAMMERVGWKGERRTVDREVYWRVGRPDSRIPCRAEDLDDPAHPALAGLLSGDVILAKNPQPQSLWTTLALREFTYFDHLGLFVVEDGGAWVYESWPKLHLFGCASTFVSRFRGKVGRTPISEFLCRYETLEWIRLPDAERNRLAVEAARESATLDILYDPQHDPEGPGLSCSEYLQMLLIEKAGYPFEIAPRSLGHNDALQRIAHSLGFENSSYVVPDSFATLPGARRVGTISIHPAPAELFAEREAYAVMHEHCRTDSPAGDYIAAHRWHFLRFRRSTLAFLEWSAAWCDDHPSEDPGETRRILEMLYEICFRPVDR
jgi:hypothetical protein